MSSQLNSYRIR